VAGYFRQICGVPQKAIQSFIEYGVRFEQSVETDSAYDLRLVRVTDRSQRHNSGAAYRRIQLTQAIAK
jgi:hypothetical protein